MAPRRKARPETPEVALGYRRVSTGEQATEGGSLDAQTSTIEKWCDFKGLTLVGVEEEAKSAKAAKNRPVLQELLDRMDRGEADVLVVSKLDRLARSAADTETLLDRAARNGWVLAPLDVGVDTTTAMGEAFAGIVAVFARLERRRIGERTKEGLDAKIAAGTLKGPLGRPPAVELSIIERVQREKDAGKSLQAIADGLTADGIPTARGAETWRKSTIHDLLNSKRATAPGQ